VLINEIWYKVAEAFDRTVITRVGVLIDGVEAARAINMGDGGVSAWCSART
jgi:hypothetical protein